MASQVLSTSLTTALLILASLIASFFFLKRHLIPKAPKEPSPNNDDSKTNSVLELTTLTKTLLAALPNNTILPHHIVQFRKAQNSHWAQQENEITPSCIIRPSSTAQLSLAIKILKREFDERRTSGDKIKGGFFAVRGGGHSPVPGAANIEGGVVIDLSLLNEVIVADDGESVGIGAGCKWGGVSRSLDIKGLAVVGGRNSAVGVGGLSLGGGISFFTPRSGLVCSNILSYEIVLASGTLVTASQTSNPDLWKALKGGSNNFGIVTKFTVRCFPGTNVWAGFLYLPGYQARKVLAAFQDSVSRASDVKTRDNFAAGPIASFSYVPQLGFQVIAVNLVYTNPPENNTAWPKYWRNSDFAKLWRIWSTCKVQSLSSATDELASLNPPGRRQIFGTCTISKDADTINAAYAAHQDAISAIKKVKVKGLVWTLVFQPFLPDWAVKGDENLMGFDEGGKEALVVVSFTVNWDERGDDGFVKGLVKRAIERIEGFGGGHKWKYLNYCAEWQRPFEGYGKGALDFLRGVSEMVDRDGLFQRGCVGGFKLGEEEEM